ncbi:MAG: FADH2 O2-dependent halogenase [Rhodothermales bacterium]|jgi:FADH2 O2-dependent halogenase
MRTDLLIIGGGFAGSILAMVARRLGLSVALVERGRHPRFAIGESSTPAGNMILDSLGRQYNLPGLVALARYGTWKDLHPDVTIGPKRGFTYFAHEPGVTWQSKAGHENELFVAASNDARRCDTHWLRADVDEWLFRRAGELGVRLIEGTEVEKLVRSASGGWSASLKTTVLGAAGGAALAAGSRTIEAALIVDATGNGNFAARHLGVAAGPPMKNRTAATFAHLDDLPAWQEFAQPDDCDYPIPADHAAQHHVTARGWMWQLRFDTGRTSVGIVTPGSQAADPQEWMSHYPSLQGQFASVGRRPPVNGWFSTGPLQRRVAHAGGKGWALMPQAAGFVDPLHSTGIAHSLAGVERVAGVLATGDSDFADHGRLTLAELDHLDTLVAACYKAPDFERFGIATMGYFAATIRYERARVEGANAPFTEAFLGADQNDVVAMGRGSLINVSGSDYRAWMTRAVAPWNDAGLLAPDVPNMYPHTAPKNW